VNFSTYFCEDFGVSLAQAQELGWPAVLSDWGGHSDAMIENVYKIHPLAIGETHEATDLIAMKARSAAAKIQRDLQHIGSQGKKCDAREATVLTTPSTLAVSAIDNLRRDTIRQLGTIPEEFFKNGVTSKAQSEALASFFDTYRGLFSGTPRKPITVIIVNELGFSRPSPVTDVPRICQSCIHHYTQAGDDVIFIALSTLGQSAHHKTLASASRIIFPFFVEPLLESVSTLANTLPPSTPILLCVPKEKVPAVEPIKPPAVQLVDYHIAGEELEISWI